MKIIAILLLIGGAFYYGFSNSPDFRNFVYKTLSQQEENLKKLDKNIQVKKEVDLSKTIDIETKCSMNLIPYKEKIYSYKGILKQLKVKYSNRTNEDFDYVKQSFATETLSFYPELEGTYNSLNSQYGETCKNNQLFKDLSSLIKQERDFFYDLSDKAKKGNKFDFFRLLLTLPS